MMHGAYNIKLCRAYLCHYTAVRNSVKPRKPQNALAALHSRTEIRFCNLSMNFRGLFRFLKPSLSEVSIIYILPFKRSVWFTYFALVAILTVAMFVTDHMQHQMDPSQPPLPFGDAVVTSLALMCQEGKP